MDGHAHSVEKTKPKRVITALLIFFALAMIIAVITLSLRNGELEMSSDYSFLNGYIKGKGNKDIVAAAEKFISENITAFEDKEAVMKSVTDALYPNSLSVARDDNYTKDKPIYTVYSDGKVFFTAALKKSGKTLSGFDEWKLDSISVAEECEVGSSAYIEVPHGAVVTVNGTELNGENSKIEKCGYHALTEFESGLSESIYSDRYSIGIFFGQPKVSAVLDGAPLSISHISGRTVKFSYPPTETTVKNITVPYGSTVSVNGITLSGKYISETGLKYPFLTRFEEDKDGLTRALTYRISGLFNEPEISVSYNGTVLESADGGRKYRLPDELTDTYTVLAPQGAVVKVNGVVLGSAEVSKKKAEFPILKDLTSYAKDRPYLVEYTVSGLLSTPKVTASDAEGNVIFPDASASKDKHIIFSVSSSVSPPDKDKTPLGSFIKAYVKYIYSGSSGQTANYNSVTEMTPAKSLSLTKLKSEYKKLYSADVHKKIKYGDITYSDYKVYCKNTYSCTVTLPFTAALDGNTVEKQITLELLYINSGKNIKIINYLVIP